ncbi:SH3 domain-containing C40 family peptidase [Legionella maioricensis]|uniref:SH3 domain-containing protein n=1 Tax=Legionella maioricensis TaxID=2896528 RepID=A0A9X2IAZ7_9GAMM|nr:SH3 domain-containing C40 family peptidase [Legionella maioricensis]MCL9684005.1 SH3 domain-containing protein [Legionella maioricensis]MCL9687950.1 SH3 domain-containing protein [Legionella maioricensis]
MSCSQFHCTGLIKSFIFLVLGLSLPVASAFEVPIYDFSIKAYTQNIDDHISSDSSDYLTPLLRPEYQTAQLKEFYNHYFSSDSQGLSPWSEQMVRSLLPVVKKIELEILDDFDNQKAGANRHYAENFKEHDEVWLNQIKQNMGLQTLDSLEFNAENKAIAVANTFVRALPDEAPDFFHLSLAGQGFPFDNLQESVIWSGTPLYVFSVSQDKSWTLVLTPDAYFGWVKSSDVAYASSRFINQWQTAAQKGLVAITQTGVSIVDKNQHFKLKGYIGAVFPYAQEDELRTFIFIPAKNEHHQAIVTIGAVSKKSAGLMPLVASKKNMAKIMRQLQNRPYGWGGTFFFNDCSQEIKSIFTPFGIWLPRNSAQQAQLSSGLDLSKNNMDERITTLKEKGHPLMTVIYIGGHVMLYVGNKKMDDQQFAPMTYQNVWGLSPESRDKRYVIGQSLFFPLLKYYPENPDVSSLANKAYFKLVYLDELGANATSPQAFAKQFTKIISAADL